MNSLRKKMTGRTTAGFTILELLVVIAIVALIIAIVLAYLSYSRKRAVDAGTKATLSDIRITVAQESMGQPANAFNSGTKAKGDLDTLATRLGYAPSDNGTLYQYDADSTGYVAIYPLQTDQTPYWCVDAEGAAIGTIGLLETTGDKSCANATRDPNLPVGEPDLTISSLEELSITGMGSTATLPITISEINGVQTIGPITLRVRNVSGITLTLDSTPDWTMTTSRGGVTATITSNDGVSIPALQNANLALTLTKNNSNISVAPLSLQIIRPSGGETNTANNLFTTTLTQN